MGFVAVIVVAAAVFGLCYLIDKGFTKLFRSQAQHRSGMSVRLNKRYGSIGLLLAVLGVAAVFAGINSGEGWILPAGGGIIIVTGAFLVAYYIAYGVFYDENSFLFTTIGKRAVSYAYRDIKAQQIFNNQGHILIELYMTDGNTVQIQGTMSGAYGFLDYAFEAWCRQTGRSKAECTFYDPANSCWFPPLEG